MFLPASIRVSAVKLFIDLSKSAKNKRAKRPASDEINSDRRSDKYQLTRYTRNTRYARLSRYARFAINARWVDSQKSATATPAQTNLDNQLSACKIVICDAGIAQLVERNLAKVEVASSSLVSRSSLKGERIKDQGESFPTLTFVLHPFSFLLYARRRSQVVRQRSAKPLFVGSIPTAASNEINDLGRACFIAFLVCPRNVHESMHPTRLVLT